ncbi:D-glucuronyl C5-epimerase family protein [Oceanithermus sp.]|uniref:D-glucuronyl C5-epimerase family protein n=1 Tax=Oceanithermus sp. TaxID=2268145 RepID=UPI0025E8E175|nr:D-glucuronyl C5-epimerase family protein [Oceanithermus sp.]
MNRYARLALRMALVAVCALALSNLTEPFASRYASMLLQLARYGSPSPHLLSEDGVPSVRYTRLQDRYYHNPVYVGIYGLYYYDRWLESGRDDYFLKVYVRFSLYPPSGAPGDEIWRERFLATADWFVENLVVRRSHEGRVYGVYEYPFAWEFYNLSPPWQSGMAQGLALQVLLRAWQTTGEERYLTTAERVKQAFFVPTHEGGVTYKDTPDAWWYEEYASPGAKPSRVLNGMEHALVALHEYAAERGDAEARLLFERGLAALERTLANYSAPQIPWTYYDAIGTVANYKYHQINVNLTRYLYTLTGDEPLRIYTTWASWRTPFVVREFVRQRPNYLDLTILFLNFLFCGALLVVGRTLARFVSRPRNDPGSDPGGKGSDIC